MSAAKSGNLIRSGPAYRSAHAGYSLLFFGPEIFVKQLEMSAQAVPSARRIAILWDSTYEQHKIAAPSIEAAAQKLAVTLQLVPARGV